VFCLKDIEELIQTQNLTHKYNTSDALEIFKELDNTNQGYIKFHDFVNLVINKTKNDNSSKYYEFYFRTMNYFLTPCQRIIKTVQKTKNKLDQEKEQDTIKELEW
jgi:Ca2+-binding EF-hand superfamily protein